MPRLLTDSRLTTQARKLRRDVITMLAAAGSGHPGGSLGMADIFAALFFGGLLSYRPNQPHWPGRDRLVLSNGHICPILYASLARAGFFPVEHLQTLRQLGSPLQGHPHRGELPGLETTGGPLGQGISQAVGMAIYGQRTQRPWRVVCITSDGEHDEGQTWEAVLCAAKERLGNLTVIVDRNDIQISGKTSAVMPLGNLATKYHAFGWNVVHCDGHSFADIRRAFAKTKRTQPTVIVAHTVPGRGVSFMEHDYRWHGRAPQGDEVTRALADLA